MRGTPVTVCLFFVVRKGLLPFTTKKIAPVFLPSEKKTGATGCIYQFC